ncbi:hypothetical protein FACS189454_06830 [Planctomycetales bacterium]|nr:hypothetical protein FACS189454_06830 [Planctomycetales bacterium]
MKKEKTQNNLDAAPALPVSAEEMQARGWESVDIVFVTGDAYVDHPSFAAALLTRLLEAEGYKVGVLAQPDWHSADAWKTFGKPNLAFCVSAGNMDSMINHYTANRKVRNSDAYSPGGKIGLRPDRATLSYCQRAREAAMTYWETSVPIIAGGVEASLRRFAHYDYWSDKIKRSMVLDSKCDLLAFGMGEAPLLEILQRLKNGEPIESIRNVRGTAYRLKRTEDLPEETETVLYLPSQEEAEEDKSQFAKMTRMIYENLNPYLGITLVQEHALEAVVCNPPPLPLTTKELDKIYALPFTRKPHPSYGKAKIPALETVKDSIQIHRGCFGGCTFCSLTAHQGKFIQSRSADSILKEAENLPMISDLGGPTANMYALDCKNEAAKKKCLRLSCLTPSVCPNLNTDHSALIKLMRQLRNHFSTNGGNDDAPRVMIASGVRTDLALLDERYIKELVEHHTGGHLKTAPEHTNETVLFLMNKPMPDNYDMFCGKFAQYSETAGKEQYLVPYLMAGFPGTTLPIAVETAIYLKKHRIKSEQVQEFIPAPFELATCMYYTGLNPITGQPVYVPRKLRERRLQKALLMYDEPNHYHDIKQALVETGRQDLIGDGAECLIKSFPPKALAMKRSSKVKRYQKQNAHEKQVKEERRTMYAELERQEQFEKRAEKRRARADSYDRGSDSRSEKRFERRPERGADNRSEGRFERRPERGTDNRSEGRFERRPERGTDNRSERRFERRPERGTNNRSEGRFERRPERGADNRSERRFERRPERGTDNRSEGRFERRPERGTNNRSEGRFERRPERGTGNRSEGRFERRPERGANNRSEGRFERRPERGTDNRSEGRFERRPERSTNNRSEGRFERRPERGTDNRAEKSGGSNFQGERQNKKVRATFVKKPSRRTHPPRENTRDL